MAEEPNNLPVWVKYLIVILIVVFILGMIGWELV